MTPQELAERDAVDRVARSWIGTPFHDHGEIKGRQGGVDCAKLLKCVFVEAGLLADFKIEHYSPQHFLHQDREQFLEYVRALAEKIVRDAGRSGDVEIAEAEARYGDIVLYKAAKVFCHGGIIVKPGWPSIIHAHHVARCVREARGRSIHLGAKVTAIKFFTIWPRA
jgi:hypothetical protein